MFKNNYNHEKHITAIHYSVLFTVFATNNQWLLCFLNIDLKGTVPTETVGYFLNNSCLLLTNGWLMFSRLFLMVNRHE